MSILMDGRVIEFLAVPALGVCFHVDKITPPVCKFPYDFRRVKEIQVFGSDSEGTILYFTIITMTDTDERVKVNDYHIGYKK